MTPSVDGEYQIPTKDAETEEKKDLDEKPSESSEAEPVPDHNSTANNSDKTPTSAVNMAGIVQAGPRELTKHLSDTSGSGSGSRFSRQASQKSIMSHHSQTSVWESDFNDVDEEETSYGDEDDDFYDLHGHQGGAGVPGAGPPGAAFTNNNGPPQDYDNPHIQQTMPIPEAAQHTPDPIPPKPTASISSAASKGSAASQSSRASSRRSRRGSMRAPGDEGSSQSMRETVEERREREFKERLEKLERQSSANRVGQPKPREPCKCTKDLIPVIGSLLLLAVGIAVAIYLLFGSDEESSSPIPAPTPSPTAIATIDPNPFRRRNLEWNLQPPTESDCQEIQNGGPIVGQDMMASIKVDATMDITTYGGSESMIMLIKELVDVSAQRIVPSLAGCLDQEESSYGRVRTTAAKLRRRQQILEEGSAHYTISNGKLIEISFGSSSSCEETAEMSGPCYRIDLGFEFWHRSGEHFSMQTLVDEFFSDRMTSRMTTGDIVSQAKMISVVQR